MPKTQKAESAFRKVNDEPLSMSDTKLLSRPPGRQASIDRSNDQGVTA